MSETELNILFVDDEESIREIFISKFSNYFKKIYEASNGLEALEIIDKEKIDLIFADMEMPKMNGIKLLEAVFKKNQEIPFIILTAFSNKEVALAALHFGAHDVLEKPINDDAVIKIISRIQGNRQFKDKYNANLVDEEIRNVLLIPDLSVIDESELRELRSVAMQILRAKDLKELLRSDRIIK